MKSIGVVDLSEALENEDSLCLIDIREDWERDICKITPSLHFPMSKLEHFLSAIPTEEKVVIYCHHGIRSASIIQFLEHDFKMENLYNLQGGISEWISSIDQTMTDY